MKKICYVATVPGTIKSFFIPQLQYLADNGFDVTVICGNNDDLQDKLGLKIKYIPVDMPRGISILGSIKSVFQLIKIFRMEHFDIVQYSTPNAAMYASLAGIISGIKLRNYHMMGFRYLGFHGFGRTIMKSLERITCLFSTSIECVSQSNLQLGISEGFFPKDKAVIVWNGSTGGVDLRRFDISKSNQWRSEIRKQLGFSEKDFVYGFVGRVTRDKGVNELLDAFLSLQDDSKLCIIGHMEDKDSLDKTLLCNARNSSNIIFHDRVGDIERYYAAIDVLVLPSYREGFGNVIIESAAVGTPSIVSDIPGPIDAIERDVTALVVKVKDAQELLEGMKRIRTIDYVQMGKDARQFVESSFDSEKLCKKILERKLKLCQELC